MVVEGFSWPVGVLGGTAIAGILLVSVLFIITSLIAKRTESAVGESLIKHCRGPARIIFPILLVQMVLPLAEVPAAALEALSRGLSIGLTLSVAWLVIKLANVGEDLIFIQYRIDVRDNLEARKIHTQTRFLKRLVIVIVSILAGAVILMTFDKVRQLGTSILASAGIAGIIIGFAAQKSIANLLAGFQIAFTNPINIDDVVIVEGEWGRIEEITLTYVVVRIWDLRRLILPITYFIEKPFQNWTRVSADLLGTVFLSVDYTVPVGEIRGELTRILDGNKLWDGKVNVVQVTNATEHTMEVRALMSAADSSNLWDLRCEVREKLIRFVRENYPQSLPKTRAEILDRAHKPSLASRPGKTEENPNN